jgi:hypothetical protein
MGCSSSHDQEVVTQIKDQQKRIDELIKKNEVLEKRLGEYPVSMSHLGKNTSENGSDLTILRTTIESRFNKLEKTVERIHNDFKTKIFEGLLENNVEVGQALTPHVTQLNNNQNLNKSEANGEVTLSFDFEKEPKTNEVKPSPSPWNDLLHDSAITPAKIATANHITADKADDESRTIDKSMKTGEKTPRMEFGIPGIEEEDVNIELSSSTPAKQGGNKEAPATTSKVRDASKGSIVLKESDIDNKRRPVTSIGDLNSKKKVPLTTTQAKGKLEELLNDEKVKKIYSDVQNKLFKKQGNTPSTTTAGGPRA